ncbi:hypothetical protein [Candidatus Chromulinivorax destructor]|uniref:Uncharacterized protein n=1 Tax=Candidatus Chromulinivorax destructor TaxID=2066483 RepID=A0A345ZBH9_9BACT|nr:hypothetical protein [Candidatus Chromulinivorax destructor]AXK60646.1 hypothetical protein C0J27_02715 [Candidatus Chromulinivorax destructor]
MKQQNNKASSVKTDETFFAEILESNITNWQAQSWKWDAIPEFGSLVIATSDNRTLFGIIYDITTGPIDPIRQPVAYQKTQEELLQEQPQIFEFLTTSFSCLSIGYQENNQFFYNLPPQPPKMHTFVGNATTEQYATCFSHEHFLHLIFNTTEQINREELLLAIIRHQLQHNVLTKKRLNKFIESFFMLNRNNYLQTKMFLPRLQKLLESTAGWQELA